MGPTAHRHLCSHWSTVAVVKDTAWTMALSSFSCRSTAKSRTLLLPATRWGCLLARHHKTVAVLLGIRYSCPKMFQPPVALWFPTDAGSYWQKPEHAFLRVEEGKLFWKILWSTLRTHRLTRVKKRNLPLNSLTNLLFDLRQASASVSHVNITYVTEAERIKCLQSALKAADMQYIHDETVFKGKESWRGICMDALKMFSSSTCVVLKSMCTWKAQIIINAERKTERVCLFFRV